MKTMYLANTSQKKPEVTILSEQRKWPGIKKVVSEWQESIHQEAMAILKQSSKIHEAKSEN